MKNPSHFRSFLGLMEEAIVASRLDAPRLLGYALTFGPVAPATSERIDRFVAQLGAGHTTTRTTAAVALAKLGEPAYRALGRVESDDPEVRKSIAKLRAGLAVQRNGVLRSGLHRDIVALWGSGPEARARVLRILPPGADRADPVAWWRARGTEYRWLPASDRYARSEGFHGRSLRFRDRDLVEIDQGAGLLDLDGNFTAEMWVRLPRDASGEQYLIGADAWPGMHPRRAVDHKSGWVLRRYPANGLARFNVVFATTADTWFGVMSDAVRIGGDWEHVALVKTPERVRIFLNGTQIAERSCLGVRFRESATPLYLGGRRYGPNVRSSRQDLRAVRLSRTALYADAFDPQPRLARRDDTVALYDFTGDPAPVVPDLSGHGRHGTVRGALWMPTFEPAGAAATLRDLGVAGGAVTVVEAERGRMGGNFGVAGKDVFSEGRGARAFTNVDTVTHTLALRFRVTAPGRHRLYLAGEHLHRLPVAASPFAWCVDDAPFHTVAEPRPTVLGLTGTGSGLLLLGIVDLPAGEHVFHLRLTGKCTGPPQAYSLWLDALVLQHLG